MSRRMSRLVHADPHTTRTLAWSVGLYRWLLLAYPARFRMVYGPQMTQVFRDCCRQAHREGGLWSVGRLWPRTLADLAVSALAERYAGGIRMSRWTPARYCAFAAILGGAIWIGEVLYNIISIIIGGAMYYGPGLTASYIFAATWILFPIGLMGLLMLAGGRGGALSWLGYTVTFAGGLMLLVGNLGITYIRSYATYVGGVQVVHLTGYDPVGEGLKLLLYQSSFLGYPVLGIGVALVGLALWRAGALPRFNLLPLGLGVLVALQYFFTDMGAPSLLRNTGTPGLLVMMVEYGLFILAWAVGWMLLGRMVWRAAEWPSPELQAHLQVQAQAQSAQATSQAAAS